MLNNKYHTTYLCSMNVKIFIKYELFTSSYQEMEQGNHIEWNQVNQFRAP